MDPTQAPNGTYREVINLCGQGDAQDQRQGNKIYLKWFALRGRLIQSSGGAATDIQRVRIMVVMDKQMQSGGGVAPTYGDILQSTGASNYITAMYDRSQMLNNRRFKILYDRVHTVTKNGQEGTINKDKLIKIYCPIKKQVTFNATDTSIALGRNWVYLYVFSDQTGAAGPTLDYDWRSSFIDN